MRAEIPRPELEDFLREHYGEIPVKQIARMFSVTVQMVHWRIIKLGLNKDSLRRRRNRKIQYLDMPGAKGPAGPHTGGYFNVNARANWLV